MKDQLTDALKDLKSGIPIVTEKQTVARFLSHWLDQVVTPRVRPKTLRTNSDIVKLHISPLLGEVPLGKLSPQQIREFLNAKLTAGLSPRTVKHILVTLRGALSVAAKDGQIPRNVAALVDPPRVLRREVQAFNPEQARYFLEAARTSRLEAATPRLSPSECGGRNPRVEVDGVGSGDGPADGSSRPPTRGQKARAS